MVRKVPKHLYLFTYLNEEGEEGILEVPAYSAVQAEMAAQSELHSGCNVVSVEEAVRKDRRMCECFD